ncbi:MAG TPA: hypothetical protein VKA70_16260 [Blastocatellia bacterium]|nr:hypothetical protein [Blastocatellia bacterium]
MKVRELIEQLRNVDPNADIVARGHRDFFYPLLSVEPMNLKPIAVIEQNTRAAIAYRDTMKSHEGVPCLKITID